MMLTAPTILISKLGMTLKMEYSCRTHLRKTNIVLNYKDKDGDLIEICDREDIEMMKTDATPPRKLLPGNCHAPWAIYVTLQGDHTPYNSELPGLPRRAR